MQEKDATDSLRKWLEAASFSVYTGGQFRVEGGGGRPDMVISSNASGNDWNAAIEIKRSKSKDVNLAEKIINYARAYRDGAEYIIDGKPYLISDFLIATELSEIGRLFDDDIPPSDKRKRKQQEFYQKYPFIEPYFEWQRSADFLRGIWRKWKDRSGMEEINIGVLLSSINDKFPEKLLTGQFRPMRFIMHFSFWKRRWTQLWKRI